MTTLEDRVFLVYDDTIPPELYYETPYGWYYARTLDRVNLREIERTQPASRFVQAGSPTNPQRITTLRPLLQYLLIVHSSPVFIKTTNSWAIAFAHEGSFIALPAFPNDEIIRVIQFEIPDISSIIPGANRLTPVDLPPFNRDYLQELVRLANNQLTILNMQIPPPHTSILPASPPPAVPLASPPISSPFELPRIITPPGRLSPRSPYQTPRGLPPVPLISPQPSPPISPPVERPSLQENLKESYETLLKQLYGLPVKLPSHLIVGSIQAEIIPFKQATQMLSRGQIAKFLVDPMLQPWAGPPSSPNRILSFYGTNGLIYLTKGKYNSTTNQIFPPE